MALQVLLVALQVLLVARLEVQVQQEVVLVLVLVLQEVVVGVEELNRQQKLE